MAQTAFDPISTYTILEDGGAALTVDVTPTFWDELVSGEHRSENVKRVAGSKGRLLTCFELSEDFKVWEMHPKGDELLIALSGAYDVFLELPEGEKKFALEAGRIFIVPQGTWHRAVVRTPGRVIFLTPGEGTEHKEIQK